MDQLLHPSGFRPLLALLFLASASAPAVAGGLAVTPSPQAMTGLADGDPLRYEWVGGSGAGTWTWLSGSATQPSPASPAPEHLAGGLPADFILTGELPEGDTPSAAAFTADGSKIVVAHRDSGNIVIFDAATRVVLDVIPLSGSPNDVAVTSGGLAVTANIFEDTASIVDLNTGTETAVIPVGNQPGVVAISPNGLTAAIGNTIDSSVSVINLLLETEVRRIFAIDFVGSIAVAFEPGAITAEFNAFQFVDANRLIHADFYADLIEIINTQTGAVSSLAAADAPRGVAVTPDGSKAVVSHTGTVPVISVVDPSIPVIVKTIVVGATPDGPIAINPDGSKAVVAVLNACRVVRLDTNLVSLDLATAGVSQLFTTAGGSYALANGFRGSLIEYSSETIVREVNIIVSAAVGAVSPAGPRAAMISNTFGEDMAVANTNGALGFLEGVVPSGPPPEGDKARTVALTPDGSRAVVANILSDNASIVDLAGLAVEDIVGVGNRPAEVAVRPDGSQAVVANLDSPFVSVIDLATSVATNIPISTRGSEVEISPDGQYAYVAVVMDDGVWRVNLNTLAVEGPKLVTGNMGGIIYLFNQTSGMTLSHDGATLVTCNSFSPSLTLIDTSSWTVAATVPVSGFPVRATFTADDNFIYVSCRDDATIKVVTNAGGSSSVIDTIPVGDWPFEMAFAPDGNTLYVANFQSENIGVVDVESSAMTATIPLPDPPQGIRLVSGGAALLAATGNWSVTVGPGPAFSIATSGQFSLIDTATRVITDQIATGLPPAMLAFDDANAVAVITSPFGDGVTRVDVGTALSIAEPPGAPGAAKLILAAAPNPCRWSTTLRFTLARSGPVRLSLHDAAGRCVTTIFDGMQVAGAHAIRWEVGDAAALARLPLSGGIYFARLTAHGEEAFAKIVIAP